MEIIIAPNAVAGSVLAAEIVRHTVITNPKAVLGLATGRTPLLLYEELVRMHRTDGLSFRGVTSFNLDEYLDLPPTHKASYRRYINEVFLAKLDIDLTSTFVPSGSSLDAIQSCSDYEAKIRAAGGIDIQILGIGTDGHIGFNEPSSSLGSRTRVKTLTEQTRRDNVQDFDGSLSSVPYHVITMGIGTIMEARTCLLLAFGKGKSRAVAATIEGAVTAMVPASALQLHPDVRIILDLEAAALLEHRDYYEWVYRNKPK